MRLISRKKLIGFYQKHPAARAPLEGWFAIARAAEWKTLADTRRAFPSADAVRVASGRAVTVFNIGDGNFRLLAALHYNRGVAFVLEIQTHAEYDRGKWKELL